MSEESDVENVPVIATTTQATAFIEERITDLETLRLEVDIAQTVGEQRRLYQKFMVRHGYVTGLVDAYVSTGHLPRNAHDALRARVLRTMLPSQARGIAIAGANGSKL